LAKGCLIAEHAIGLNIRWDIGYTASKPSAYSFAANSAFNLSHHDGRDNVMGQYLGIAMSEPTTPVPAENPTPVAAAPVAPPQAPRPGPPRPGDRGPKKPLPPRSDRPRNDGTKPPPMDKVDFASMRPSKRDLDAMLESELDAALAGFDVKGTVVEEDTKKKTTFGVQPKKKGKIIGIHGKDVFVEVPGGRSQGFLPLLQFTDKAPVIGDEVEFDIEGYDGTNGLLKLTMTGASSVAVNWSSVARGMVVEAKVTGVNKNRTGLQVEVNGIKAFMPISQIDLYRVEKPEDFINQKLKCQVIELNPAEHNMIVSRKAILERERLEKAEKFWATLEEGQVKTGIVKSIKPFGAFVDLDGAADGLIPVSELSWSRVGDPSEVVQIGQKVEVMVSRIDRETRKIGLSLRATVRSPWDDFASTAKPGARLNGKVTRIEDFGAFVELAPGIEGLVHISEMSTMKVRRVRDAVSEGQEVTVQILNYDAQARRISLSLKALQAEAEEQDATKELAEKEADILAAETRLAERLANPNSKLRGGIGAGRMLFEMGE
jgi:small subunit ribosomal protein S1